LPICATGGYSNISCVYSNVPCIVQFLVRKSHGLAYVIAVIQRVIRLSINTDQQVDTIIREWTRYRINEDVSIRRNKVNGSNGWHKYQAIQYKSLILVNCHFFILHCFV